LIIFLIFNCSADINAQNTGIFRSGKKGHSTTTSNRLKDFNTGWRWIDRDWGAAFVPGIYKSYSSIFIDTDKKREAILWEEDAIATAKSFTWLEDNQLRKSSRWGSHSERGNGIRSLDLDTY